MKLWQGKSKFYKEFMKGLITDILAVILGILFLVGFVRALFHI